MTISKDRFDAVEFGYLPDPVTISPNSPDYVLEADKYMHWDWNGDQTLTVALATYAECVSRGHSRLTYSRVFPRTKPNAVLHSVLLEG